MNTILWQLKLNKKYLLIYILFIIIFIIASISKYQVFVDDHSVLDIINTMPKSLQVMLGMFPGLKLYILKDYLIMIYYYLNIIISIFVINLAFELKNNDFKDNSYEYQYTRPISFKKLYLSKYLSGIISILIISLLLIIINIILIIYYHNSFNILLLNIAFILNYILIYNIAFLSNKINYILIIYLIGIPLYSLSIIFELPLLTILSLPSYFTSNIIPILIGNTFILGLSFIFINISIKKLSKNDIISWKDKL